MYSDVEQALEYLFPELKESEDEKIRKGLIAIITDFESLYLQENYSLSKEETLAWFKKQDEQKPAEWSEEDKPEDYKDLIEQLQSLMFEWSNKKDNMGICINKHLQKIVSSIKSLRPQSQWKPSKEQMEALKSSTYCQDEQMSKVLFELYQDLLKLREE